MIDARALQTALGAAGYSVPVDGDLGPKTWGALFAFVGRTQLSLLTIELGATADRWLAPAAINTPLRVAHALAQWAVETGGFTRMEESLTYSVERLCAVWPDRFPHAAAAQPFANRPVALANCVYGGRCGNNAASDGWTYRGRGPTQLTFRGNYKLAGAMTGLDLLGDPDTVAQADAGLRVACAYWTARNINVLADRDDIFAVRRAVNGGENGLDDAQRYLVRAKLVLK